MTHDAETHELLRGIWNEMKALGKNLGGRIDALKGEIVAMRLELKGTNDRIDNVLLGEHRAEHVELRDRVTRLERHVGLEPG
ncbi:MAG: hypothetical protein KC503_45390 [Myxococcales bacterium]|nr:hypothetical protein [Myxococcales bacterium]